MSDEYDDRREWPGPDPEGRSDDHEQDRVARLLADAGGQEPMPADVAARLDAVLEGLARAGDPARSDAAHEPAPDSPPAPAPGPAPGPARAGRPDPRDELAAGRRRRRWPQLLAAATTVSVLGLGAGTLLDSMSGGGGDSAEDATAGAAAEDPDAAGVGENAAQDGPAPTPRQQPPGEAEELDGDRTTAENADAQALVTVGVPRLRSDSLAVDVQRAADLSRPADDGRVLARACVQPDLAPGDAWLRARLDRAPAVLVLRDPVEGRRTAEVFTCDDGDTPAASVRIDAR